MVRRPAKSDQLKTRGGAGGVFPLLHAQSILTTGSFCSASTCLSRTLSALYSRTRARAIRRHGSKTRLLAARCAGFRGSAGGWDERGQELCLAVRGDNDSDDTIATCPITITTADAPFPTTRLLCEQRSVSWASSERVMETWLD